MAPTRTLSRRSFLGRVAGNDRGPNADPANGGRGSRGSSDADRGPNADPAGQGRGVRRASLTDADAGSNADPADNGRGRRRGRCRGLTDSDSGNGVWTDPARCGRGPHN